MFILALQELGTFGRLRKISRCGPVSMFRQLVVLWRDKCSPTQVAEKVQHFFRCVDVQHDLHL